MENQNQKILHTFENKEEFIILLDNKIFYWRPNQNLTDLSLMDMYELLRFKQLIESKKIWKENKKSEMIKHLELVYQTMRDIKINEILR